MTSQQQLVCDSSTLSNFVQWASAISGFLGSCGFFTKAGDSGQVNWSTIAAVPGANAYVYEMWQSNDGLTTFYLKMEYGNVGAANSPGLRLTLGTGSDGSGNLTGYTTSIWRTSSSSNPIPSSTTQYECDFSGAAGRVGALLWRNAPTTVGQLFAIERSINASGAYTGVYVTLYTMGTSNNGVQSTLVFGVGVAPTLNAAWNVRALGSSVSGAFNGSIPIDTCSPCIGFFDYAGTVVGCANSNDLAEGVQFSATIAGASHNYLPTKNGNINHGPGGGSGYFVCLRFD